MTDQDLEKHSSDLVHNVENAISLLWDKAREASLLISTLREEKKRLLSRVEELQSDLTQSRNEILLLQSQIEKLNQEIAKNGALKNNALAMSDEEKKILQQKLKNALTKLDQYLT